MRPHADDDLRRDAIGLDADDSAWAEIGVPGHWRRHPEFATSEGPLLYRRRYEQAGPPEGRRRWLTLGGIFYQADVWLDGAYLGDPEGYFVPHTFDITALSRIGDEHVVAIEVACPPQRSHRGRRSITGVFQHWDGIDRTWNPGGIWRPVRVYDTGPVRIDRFRVLCRDADESRAHMLLSARLDSDGSRGVTLLTLVDGVVVADNERRLAAGLNEVNWTLDIGDPQLWWPRALGDQPLTTIDVMVIVDGESSDSRSRRTGLRYVAWNDWTCSVNGERLFIKGANLLPTRIALAEVSDADARRDVELAVEAGLDALRVHGHIATQATYDAADELGMLLLQDFPLQWGYARSVRTQAVAQARDAVDQFGHHPSIVQWNAHNEPTAVAFGIEGDSTSTRLRYAAAQQLPSWNKSVLDRWVKRAIEQRRPDTDRGSTLAASLPTSRCWTAPTATCASAGTTATSAISSDSPRAFPRLVRFCPSSAPRRCPRQPTSSTRPTGPTSIGTISRSTTACRSGRSTSACRRRTSPRSTSGGTPRRSTRRN